MKNKNEKKKKKKKKKNIGIQSIDEVFKFPVEPIVCFMHERFVTRTTRVSSVVSIFVDHRFVPK